MCAFCTSELSFVHCIDQEIKIEICQHLKTGAIKLPNLLTYACYIFKLTVLTSIFSHIWINNLYFLLKNMPVLAMTCPSLYLFLHPISSFPQLRSSSFLGLDHHNSVDLSIWRDSCNMMSCLQGLFLLIKDVFINFCRFFTFLL